jgi:hypothetical protein
MYRHLPPPAAARRAPAGHVLALVVLALALACARTGPEPPQVAIEERNQPVTDDDLRILERADRILKNESRWNHSDDRACAPGARRVSLFCALQRACIDVMGSYQHRRVAIQEVRFAIEEVAPGQRFQHRLMDFNNLGSTTFADIKKVLTTARARVAARLAGPTCRGGIRIRPPRPRGA